jgi:hypothetical protein
MMRFLNSSLFQALLATIFVFLSVQTGQAEVMSSTNFKIQSDSINSGGGLSNSETYKLEDTAGELATGESTSETYNLKAGYQQMQEVFLSLSAIDDVSMAPNLGGVTGGVATGSTAFLVTTDSLAGYTVTINSSTTPAMQSGANTIADYVPAGGVPDFLFITDPTDVHFGYTVEGGDIAQRFKDNGTVCGIDSGDVGSRCWDGLSTTPVEIVSRTSSNHPAGVTTTLLFSVGIGGSSQVAEAVYQATTTVTALPL